MKKINYLILILILIAVIFSCDNNVALGPQLNLDPPVVTITNPDFMENITGQLVIKGTAKDMQEIVYLDLTVERVSLSGNPWKNEWKGDRGIWSSRSSENSPWEESDDIWIFNEGLKGDVEWEVSIDMQYADDGEYIITIGAENNVKNKGAVVQRRVIIDNDGPVTKIMLPALETKEDGITDYYDYYDTEVLPLFDSYNLKDPSLLDKLFNQDLIFQYEVKDDFSLDKIIFQLADRDGNIFYNEEEIPSTVYDKDGEPLSYTPWSGKIIIPEDEIIGIDSNEKFYLQVITKNYDKAGNKKIKKHGWFVYRPNSDKPWTTGFGHEDDPSEYPVYPHIDFQILAYDDDGVYSVSYKLFRLQGNIETLVDEGEQIKEENASPSTFFTCNFTSPKDSNNNNYVIYIDCEDVNGTKGVQEKRYFSVIDVAANQDLIHSFGGSKPGTYGVGQDIEIAIRLYSSWGNDIEVETPSNNKIKLKLNIEDAYADYVGVNKNTSSIMFNYTVKQGDNVSVLEITNIEFNGSIITTGTSDENFLKDKILKEFNDKFSSKNLSLYTSISINTNNPSVSVGNISDTSTSTVTSAELTLTFTLPGGGKISKGSGNITFTNEDYLAPAVLSRADYLQFGGYDNLKDYYTEGINGTSSTGVVDNVAKYILNYNLDNNDPNVIAALTKEGIEAHKVVVPVASSAVTLNDVNNTMTINLSGAYALKVKGVDYSITIDKNIVQDPNGNKMIADKSETRENPGVNPPVIRVRKGSDRSISDSFTGSNPVIAVQPYQTQVKIDSQTPGASINYLYTTSTLTLYTGNYPRTNAGPATPSTPADPTSSYTAPFSIGDSSNTNRDGLIYLIRARATKNSVSADSYEIAARSVVVFNNLDFVSLTGGQLWLRGGDDPAGGDNLTPGLPLSWDALDYKKVENKIIDRVGAQLLTKDGTTNNWYWITWDGVVTLYIHFIVGTTSTAEEAVKGPHQWSWSKNRWSFQHDKFPLRPGESLRFQRDTAATGQPNNTYEFLSYYSESRQ